ncbi:acyl-CoA dehydrogenase family protein [Rhizobium sp. FKY42]|uniref:acyl-CoA dehydrogenase family protein n=1 Tax=Rhizobium sp. FKY42 TaxID=2562310 RepID=UPI0010C00374|nr:acyl-CoA dehydrogenase family protein [Rhizobium sp. FKY42]
MTYKAPLKDFRYLISKVFDISALSQTDRFAEATPDIFEAVLEEAAKLAEGVLAPLNRSGDEEGCVIRDGVVTTPKGFPEAYAQFAAGGWAGLALDPDHGGQGLPHTLHMMVDEMISTANIGFAMYRGLIDGAFNTIRDFASDDLKALWLPRLASGEVLPTMNLTEPHAGSDLGLLRTKAEPDDEGTYRITGAKIFITGGEADLTRNILHLVLARLPGAPEGSRGISLFLVPKYLEDGSRNAVSCSGIEHKMGLKSSATCSMNYDGARGWLVGAPHSGLKAMFRMMNAARLTTGMQGVCAAEGSHQIVSAYAAERRQGSAPGSSGPGPDPIDRHPDVQRMLRTQKALVQGCRALALRAGLSLDLAHAASDVAEREAHAVRLQLLTPVVKAFTTDAGVEAASLGIQIMGGHGYIREWGAEQWLRDIRVAPIYEGTNGIQALDLVGRKLPLSGGSVVRQFFAEVRADLTRAEALLPEAALGLVALDALEAATRALSACDPLQTAEAATDYLVLFGLVALAREWAGMGALSLQSRADDPDFHDDKIATARFYLTRYLPRHLGHAQVIDFLALKVLSIAAA